MKVLVCNLPRFLFFISLTSFYFSLSLQKFEKQFFFSAVTSENQLIL